MADGVRGRVLAELKKARLIAVTGVAALAGLTSSIIIGRVFGTDGRGQYAVTIAAMMVVGQVASWGLGEGLAIHASLGRRLHRPRAAVASTWLAYAAAALLFGLGLRDYALVAIGGATCAVLLQVTSYSLTMGYTWLWGLGQLVQPVAVVLMCATTIAFESMGIVEITLTYALAPLLLVGPGLWAAGARRVPGELARVSAVLWSGTQRALSVNISALVRRVDVLVLGATVSISDVGQYAVAVSLVDLCLIAPMVLAGLVLRDELRGARDSLNRIIVVTSCWMVPPIMVVGGAGFWIIPAVWGSDFASVYLIFMILVPAVVAMGVGRNLQSWRAGRSEQALVLRITLAWAPAAAGLIALCASLAGPVGAASAVSVSYVVLAAFLAMGKPRATRSAVA